MTRDERMEAAFSAYTSEVARLGRKIGARAFLKLIVDAAYPELADGTHWIAPREMTKEMTADGLIAMVVDIENRSGPLPPDTPENTFARGLIIGGCSRSGHELNAAWSAARDAYLKQEGGKP